MYSNARSAMVLTINSLLAAPELLERVRHTGWHSSTAVFVKTGLHAHPAATQQTVFVSLLVIVYM
jgi:hypothetical protein